MKSFIRRVKYKQQNFSFVKRCFHTENTKNKERRVPLFATLGANFGGGGGGNNSGLIVGLMVGYLIHNITPSKEKNRTK